jgi:shikimate dehydrogenase
MPKNKNRHIDAVTQVYCIFGSPVKHSLSPVMQNAAFKKSKINALYLAFETDDIKSAIQAMKALKIRGASVTIPHKNEALKYVDYIDPMAQEIGAINTLLNDNGRISGFNTDGYGALQALLRNQIQIKNSKILILGNGGSARAIAFTLINEKAKISIAGRNIVKISPLIKDLKKKDKTIDYVLFSDINGSIINEFDVIINTTSVGMTPDANNTPIPEHLLQKKHTAFDIVYSPHDTMFLKAGKKKGCKIIHGIEMLINQGAKQFEIWTGEKAPVDVMRKAVKQYLR